MSNAMTGVTVGGMTGGMTGGTAVGRRQFVGALAAVAGGAVLLGPGRGLLDALPFIGDPAPFTRTEVLARIGEPFRIVGGAHEGVQLMIRSIAELPNMGAAVVPNDQFAARFAAAAGVELASDMYWFATKSFGKLPLYVAPLVDSNEQIVGYEALVNRYVPQHANTGVMR
jgi:hypothetical protein